LSIDETGKISAKAYGQISKDVESVVSSGEKVIDSLQRQQEASENYTKSLLDRLRAEDEAHDQAVNNYNEELQLLFEKANSERDVQLKSEKDKIKENLEKLKIKSEGKTKDEPLGIKSAVEKPNEKQKSEVFTTSQSTIGTNTGLIPRPSNINTTLQQPVNGLFTTEQNRDNINNNGTLSATIVVNIDSVNILKTLQNVKLNRN
jgi:hypothetical protein